MSKKEKTPTDKSDYILEFLAPLNSKWQELQPNLSESATDEEKKRITNEADIACKTLKDTLLSSLQMQHLMVIAGSGTSRGQGMNGPSMLDLWSSIENLTDKDKNQLCRYKISNKIGYKADEERPNIEDFLSYCDAYLEIHRDDSEVLLFIHLCKEKILEKCTFEMTDESLVGHTTFLHRLSRRRVRDSRLKLFTTNYDLCFEIAAGKQGIVVLDGFSFTQPRYYDPRFFGYDIVRRPRAGDDLGNYLEGVVQLYKIHGSINWARSIDGKYITTKEKPSAKEACLIYPAKGKYQQTYIEPHLELVAQYLSSLREPNTCLIVIGFGFNDEHLAEPIISAVKTNPHMRLIVVDASAAHWEDEKISISAHCKALFDLAQRGFDVWFINSTFQDFSNMIPDLKSLTPADKLAKDIRQLAGGL